MAQRGGAHAGEDCSILLAIRQKRWRNSLPHYALLICAAVQGTGPLLTTTLAMRAGWWIYNDRGRLAVC